MDEATANDIDPEESIPVPAEEIEYFPDAQDESDRLQAVESGVGSGSADEIDQQPAMLGSIWGEAESNLTQPVGELTSDPVSLDQFLQMNSREPVNLDQFIQMTSEEPASALEGGEYDYLPSIEELSSSSTMEPPETQPAQEPEVNWGQAEEVNLSSEDEPVSIWPPAAGSTSLPAGSVDPSIPSLQSEPSDPVAPVLPVTISFGNAGTQAEPGPYPVSVLPMSDSHRKTRKIALILSGGGARGAFQVGAEKYAREVFSYHWDVIAGVSVGALNGTMLAMHRYARLMEIWNSISDEQVYTGGFNLVSLAKILFGGKSFYGNEPLRRMMGKELEAGRIIDDLRVGAVSIITGEYVRFTKEFLELPSAILASTAIPVVWSPVDVSLEHPGMVDGGVRNLTPIGDVLDLEPDEIVIINCGIEKTSIQPSAGQNVLSIGMRALDIMQNEIFINDMKDFLRINALVKDAESQGCVLHHPKSGRPLKYYRCQVIEPETELGGVLDFSQVSVQAAIRAGVKRAREVLGRR